MKATITVSVEFPDNMALDDVAEGFNAILDNGLACVQELVDGDEATNSELLAGRIFFPSCSPTEVVPA